MKPISFDEWCEANPELKEQSCPTCKGKGLVLHDCDCEHCTLREEGEECPDCNGGKDIALPTLRSQYNKMVQKETAKLERWNSMVSA